MRKLWPIAWHDLQIEFSARGMLFFFLGLPLLFTTFLGAGLAGLDEVPSDICLPLLLVDEDQSALSAQLVTELHVTPLLCPVIHARAEAEHLLADEQSPALLLVPAGFQRAALVGETVTLVLYEGNAADQTLAARQAVLAAVSRVNSSVAAAWTSVSEAERLQPFADAPARQGYFEQGVTLAQDIIAHPQVQVTAVMAPELGQRRASSYEQSSIGQLVTWSLLTLVGAAELFVNERLNGTLRRLLSTPTHRPIVLAGKITGRLILGLVQMVLLISFSWLAFGISWGRSLPALALMMFSFGLAAVSFGVLLATLSQTRAQAAGLGVLFAMAMAALGGAWWPLEVTPPLYRIVAQISPSYWAVTGFLNVVVRGSDVAGVLPHVGVLLGFAATFFAIGVWRFRYE